MIISASKLSGRFMEQAKKMNKNRRKTESRCIALE
jgi:hypothetical protein